MSRRIIQGVIGSTGRANSPTGRGSSPTVTAAAHVIKYKRKYGVYSTFSSDIVRVDYTKLFFTSEKNTEPASAKDQGQNQGQEGGRTSSRAPSRASSSDERKRPLSGATRECLRQYVTPDVRSHLVKHGGCSSSGHLRSPWSKRSPIASARIPRAYIVPPSIPHPVRTLGTAIPCPFCGGVFHCTCSRTWAHGHRSAPLIWIRNPWPNPAVSS